MAWNRRESKSKILSKMEEYIAGQCKQLNKEVAVVDLEDSDNDSSTMSVNVIKKTNTIPRKKLKIGKKKKSSEADEEKEFLKKNCRIASSSDSSGEEED